MVGHHREDDGQGRRPALPDAAGGGRRPGALDADADPAAARERDAAVQPGGHGQFRRGHHGRAHCAGRRTLAAAAQDVAGPRDTGPDGFEHSGGPDGPTPGPRAPARAGGRSAPGTTQTEARARPAVLPRADPAPAPPVRPTASVPAPISPLANGAPARASAAPAAPPAPRPAPPPAPVEEESPLWDRISADTEEHSAKIDTAPRSGRRLPASSRKRQATAPVERRRLWLVLAFIAVFTAALGGGLTGGACTRRTNTGSPDFRSAHDPYQPDAKSRHRLDSPRGPCPDQGQAGRRWPNPSSARCGR